MKMREHTVYLGGWKWTIGRFCRLALRWTCVTSVFQRVFLIMIKEFKLRVQNSVSEQLIGSKSPMANIGNKFLGIYSLDQLLIICIPMTWNHDRLMCKFFLTLSSSIWQIRYRYSNLADFSLAGLRNFEQITGRGVLSLSASILHCKNWDWQSTYVSLSYSLESRFSSVTDFLKERIRQFEFEILLNEVGTKME